MRPPRHAAEDRHADTSRVPSPYGPHDPPEESPGLPSGNAECRDSYLTWLVLGLISPFLLALPLYPLLWLPVSVVAIPVCAALWALVAAIFGLFASASRNPSAVQGTWSPGWVPGPTFWDFGPLVPPPVTLTSVAAVLVAWYVLSGVVGKRRLWHPEGSAKRGFRAGLRVALLAVYLLVVWWANRTLAAS